MSEGEGVVATVRSFHDSHGDMVLATMSAASGLESGIGKKDGHSGESSLGLHSCGAPQTLFLFPPACPWPTGVWGRRTYAYVEAWEEELAECEALVLKGVEEERLAKLAIERVNELLVRRAEAMDAAMDEEDEDEDIRGERDGHTDGKSGDVATTSVSNRSFSALFGLQTPKDASSVSQIATTISTTAVKWSLDDEAVLRDAKAILSQVMGSAESARTRTDRYVSHHFTLVCIFYYWFFDYSSFSATAREINISFRSTYYSNVFMPFM